VCFCLCWEDVVSMKFIPYNVRWLRGLEKRKYVQKLVKQHHL